MRMLLLLTVVMPLQVFAKPPECPVYPNKRDCLQSVEENYNNLLDFIEKEYGEENKIKMIEAAADVSHYESVACQKTCLN